MAYISNSTNKTGPLSKYGGDNLNMPGSNVRAPQTKGTSGVVWGIPQTNTQFPMPSFNTANSTPATAQPVAPITRSSGTTSTPSTTTPQSGYVAPTSGYTSPTNTSGSGWTDAQRGQLNDIIAGVGNLQTAFDSYKKGLVETPTVQKKENTNRTNTSQFGQFTQGLLNRQTPSKDQERLLRQMERQAGKGEEIGRRAAEISDMYGGEIARVGRLGAGAVAGAKTTGTDVVGRGNAAIASESASNRIAALGAAQAAALQGTAQQLTGAEQGITAFNNALLGANTQQGLGIQALQAGGTLAQPSTAQYGQTVFDPVTGQYTGGSLDPATQANNLAQQVLSGAMTYDQAIASLGYAGNVGTNFLNNAITAGGGNPLQLQAQNAAQQANIATQGTAGTEIARQGLQEATTNYINTSTAAQYAGNQSGRVLDILAQTGLNDVSSTDYNRALREIQQRFSDVNRTALNTALTEAQIAYTNLLSQTGGTPTGREAQALNTLNIDNSAAAIMASIGELEAAVANRLQAQYGALQQYNQNLGTGGTVGGSTGSGGIWDW